jgi:hypothetical protein
MKTLRKQHTCAVHSQCVNTGQLREVQQIEGRVIVRKGSVYLKHYVMKAYERVDVLFHIFLTSSLVSDD